jgi:hypothetical protein
MDRCTLVLKTEEKLHNLRELVRGDVWQQLHGALVDEFLVIYKLTQAIVE